MAINNYFDNNDINIYFHMKNHYKKLRSARSTIDNSFSQGFVKSFSTPPSSGRSIRGTTYEERHNKNDAHLPTNSMTIKKHSCVGSVSGTSNTSINTINLPLRSRARKHPFEIISKMQCKPRSQSTGPTRRTITFSRLNKSKKKGNAKGNLGQGSSKTGEMSNLITPHIKNVDLRSDGNQSTSVSKEMAERIIKPPRVEEHEYLEFILRITEDIIINNVYTNEDLEKVFQAHIEANKNHLKVEKMNAQLARLCTKLGIPYKNNVYSKNLGCYEYFFNSYAPNHSQKLEDCECISKRILEIDSKEDMTHTSISEEEKQDFDVCYEEKVSSVDSSLSRVIECNEQSNSVSSLVKSMEHLSENIQHSTNINILPCFQNTRISISDESSNEALLENMLLNTEDKISNGPDLTDKEKLGCLEEELLFQKGNIPANLIDEIQHININDPENKPNENIGTNNDKKLEPDILIKNIREETIINDIIDGTQREKNIINNVTDKGAQRPNVLNILNNKTNKTENLDVTGFNDTEDKVVECLNCYNVETMEKSDICSSLNPYIGNSSTHLTPVKNSVQNNADRNLKTLTFPENISKVTNDQYTQIEVKCSDKECNTSTLLNEYHTNDYVLVNGPVFVLEKILNSEEKLVIYDKRNNEKHICDKEEKLCSEKIDCIQHYDAEVLSETHSKLSYAPSYHNDDFSKLLNSDYDLMPQRDSDPSNRYHNLLADAATSISNININKLVNNSFANPDTLLLNDKYELIGQKEENSIPEMGKLANQEMYENTDFHLENVLNQYELKTISSSPREEHNNSLNLSDYSVGIKVDVRFREQLPELDVSTKKLVSQNIQEYNMRENDLNKDASESGEIVGVNTYTDEELSQSSTFRSDNEKNSSNSSPIRSNILGKRKLKHPP